jgi:hypothetical protein
MDNFSSLQLLANVVSFIALVSVIIWLIFRWFNGQDKGFVAFAARHGLTFEPTSRTGYTGVLQGMMSYKTYGTDKSVGKNVALFFLTHTEGSGKNKRTYARTVAAISLKGTGAHVFVNSKLNDMQEQSGLDVSQRYTAEGDFGQYFDIYFPGGQQITTLSLFAPDVMRIIMANYGYYDMEIENDILYLYEYSYLRKVEQLESFYQLAIKLAQGIDDNSPRKLALSSGAASATSTGRLQRQKLGTIGQLMLGAIFMANVVLQGSFRLGSQASKGYSYVIIISTIVFAVVFIYKIIRNQLLQNSYRKERQFYLPPKTTDKKIGS